MSDPTMKEISRTLKEIASTLKEQNRILKTLQPPKLGSSPPEQTEPVVVPPAEEPKPVGRRFGWSMAASVQREGELKIGDQKVEKDQSLWNWTGQIWERVDAPSGEE